MKTYTIIAGVNGSGKSSLTGVLRSACRRKNEMAPGTAPHYNNWFIDRLKSPVFTGLFS